MTKNKIDRRSFLSFMVGFLVVGTELVLTACGSSSSPYSGGGGTSTPTSGGNCEADGSALETTSFELGHSHTFQLTAAQIQAADPSAVFTTSSSGGHSHSVQLTAQDYTSLQGNQGVSLTTGLSSGHTHTVAINCA